MTGDSAKRMALWQLGTLQAIIFGVGWGGFMYYMSWKDKGTSIGVAIALSILAGVLFGGTMSWFEARRRRNEDGALEQSKVDTEDT